MISPKNNKDKTIVETGPKLPIIATLEAPNRLIPSEIKNEGITVEMEAMAKPKKYTSFG